MTTTTTHVLKTDSLGRVKVSDDYREAVLDEFERGGMSGQAFAQLHGIKYTTFASWIQKRRRERGDYFDECPQGSKANEPQPTQAPVASTALTLAEVIISAPPESRAQNKELSAGGTSPSPLILRVGSDLHIEYNQRSQIPLLLELLEALNATKSC